MSSDAPVLKLYNTLTRAKEEFRPLDPANVRMYVCGPTVYDYAHIGNARPIIVFDVLFRLLRHLYGADHVTYVRNITDVDDKINARAAERGITIRELTEGTNKIFQEDVKALGCLEPTVQPRATEHIAEMIALIEKMIAAGHAYAADGHVLFDVPSMADYGRLSRRPLDEMIAGARVDVAPYKRGDMDFVLWKPSKESEPGWDSPWGRGRPGWHLECSAMSWKHLGEVFDIHGGGIDLVFPHHENEIAQTRCAFGHEAMANYWMHNGFLQVEGEKMSKSLGNFVTINELLHTENFGGRKWPGEVLRLAMLRTHYRQPIDFTVKALEEAERILDMWYKAFEKVELTHTPRVSVDVIAALSDDLNTHLAISYLHSMFEGAIGFRAEGLSIFADQGGQSLALLLGSARLIGLLQHDPEAWAQRKIKELDLDVIYVIEQISARNAARAAKNWAESDRIRDELAAMGVALKDNKDGTTTWEVKR
ncbi:cysteine--tRNA ligase [Methylosinus sporium]|uniref:Cysteine--tRNA ligase n=1 Tax=Methylosinus sporium TaxID=428 RepID=A0A549SEJ1_METSR|nr:MULTISPECIES: cysteine--tRNA ligase [Methylosinus]MBU3890711.1 cysteine--tRNA ligase [Methylosinus sp. KRF6]TRL27249.1 cysteine--tRNA ligase [Methylosinus sporium]